MPHAELKRACCEANARLPSMGLVDLTFGNVSVVDRERGVMAIKPSGVDYAALAPESIVVLDLNGRRVEGDLRPSSDAPTHLVLYRAFERIGGVVHTHSRFATSFAQAGRPIECHGTTHADFFRGAVPVTRAMSPAEIEGDYEIETGNAIVERFASIDPLEFPGVLVRGHAPFVWGRTVEAALETALALEAIAQMAYQTLALNPRIEPLDATLRDKHFLRKHGRDAYYGQPTASGDGSHIQPREGTHA